MLAVTTSCEPSWLPTFGKGMGGSVWSLTVFDDGNGPALYVGVAVAGGVVANGIAKWNGTAWSPLGSGMSGTGGRTVFALTVYDDGTGAALYAGGIFTGAGGVPADHVAKWNGTSWSALGNGTQGPVDSLAVYRARSSSARRA